MIVEEVESKIGVASSAGQSEHKPVKTVQVQYPAERASGIDGQGNSVSILYKNGLIFTAYDISDKTSKGMKSLRASSLRSSIGKTTEEDRQSLANPLANLLLPKSKSDVESVSHKFNEVGESLISKGGGTATGVLSNIASTAVFGALDSITQGVMADYNEQIHTTARSMYAGAENRTKVFTWDLTPRSQKDLEAIIQIYEAFNMLSYGEVGSSKYAQEIKQDIDKAYKESILDPLTPSGADTSNNLVEKATSFLKNVIVVSNPTVWFVRNFGNMGSTKSDVFGPCQIQSIRFDKTPNGHFNGLESAPGLSSTFVLEITMREILTLNRSSLYLGE
ncbi:baseplate tail tube cap [Pseudomonas phage PspYZU05]|uniref:Baseplate tail tube cap n=1 Tax=Pseudomonas phage PspYZU05 TaxID=1983556 RepID=A0A2U7N554_9CAUD|nr:baseplate tail tube cap [Pseudomonas phage PspYZU05]ASD52106.1 baseplate tail tube cap [Pseudomonas phage PspYZU05]